VTADAPAHAVTTIGLGPHGGVVAVFDGRASGGHVILHDMGGQSWVGLVVDGKPVHTQHPPEQYTISNHGDVHTIGAGGGATPGGRRANRGSVRAVRASPGPA